MARLIDERSRAPKTVRTPIMLFAGDPLCRAEHTTHTHTQHRAHSTQHRTTQLSHTHVVHNTQTAVSRVAVGVSTAGHSRIRRAAMRCRVSLINRASHTGHWVRHVRGRCIFPQYSVRSLVADCVRVCLYVRSSKTAQLSDVCVCLCRFHSKTIAHRSASSDRL